MSWRLEYKVNRIPSLNDQNPTTASILGEPTFESTSGDQYESEQIAAAKQCARQLVLTGVCGSVPLKVELYGHSNPNHQPRSGWSDDSVTVTVHHIDESLQAKNEQPPQTIG